MNIAEVARHCGVASSTVSYALSGKRKVSAETRERILAAIDELGYYPRATGWSPVLPDVEERGRPGVAHHTAALVSGWNGQSVRTLCALSLRRPLW
jgi:hypothetical protein